MVVNYPAKMCSCVSSHWDQNYWLVISIPRIFRVTHITFFPPLSFNNGGVKAFEGSAKPNTKDRKKKFIPSRFFWVMPYQLHFAPPPVRRSRKVKKKLEAGIGRSPVYPKRKIWTERAFSWIILFLGSHVKGLLPQKFMGNPPWQLSGRVKKHAPQFPYISACFKRTMFERKFFPFWGSPWEKLTVYTVEMKYAYSFHPMQEPCFTHSKTSGRLFYMSAVLQRPCIPAHERRREGQLPMRGRRGGRRGRFLLAWMAGGKWGSAQE